MDEITWAGEKLVLCNSRRLGARAVIAIDDTTLGPAVGGVRFAAYERAGRAVEEATRLAAAMTLKNAAAELPFGGAKSVIIREEREIDRQQLMRWFGENVAALDGSYIPGVDVGTTVADLATMSEVAPEVACDDEDPSPWTALGVLHGIRAALVAIGEPSLEGRRVVVQGAGHVGARLVQLLRQEGAEVELADVDLARAERVAAASGATVVDPAEAIYRECDVLAPCAMARVLNSRTVPGLRCRIVAGAANDTLEDDSTAFELARRGILYVPDYLLNAGGVIHIHALREGFSEEQLRQSVARIGQRVEAAIERAQAESTVPLQAAREMVEERLGRRLDEVPAPA